MYESIRDPDPIWSELFYRVPDTDCVALILDYKMQLETSENELYISDVDLFLFKFGIGAIVSCILALNLLLNAFSALIAFEIVLQTGSFLSLYCLIWNWALFKKKLNFSAVNLP